MADEITIKIPDIGGATQVDVIEILVKPGDEITKDTSLITLESDKASMEIPAPMGGKIHQVLLKVGDKVSQGDAILTLVSTDSATSQLKKSDEKSSATAQSTKPIEPHDKMTQLTEPVQPIMKPEQPVTSLPMNTHLISAGPSIRRIAREFGIDLTKVLGTGRKNRITKEDLQQYVKLSLSERSSAQGFSFPNMPVIDFSQFGAIESKPLNKIKKLTAINLHRAWVTVPHVTQFDEADITELDEFRKLEAESASKAGYKLTILAFVTKVVCKALIQFPQFNASLDPSGQNLIYKQYYNIGIAVETPNGLVVPVLKQVNQLSVADIAKEMAALSKKAREKTLLPGDMMGGSFTISSLGGIGGTAFTPIVNAPEVAILGLSRSVMKPVYEHGEFKPCLMLPLSLSYDHRVIDGAEAARFTRLIAELLKDIRLVLL